MFEKKFKLRSSGGTYTLKDCLKDTKGRRIYEFVRRKGLTKKLVKMYYESQLEIDHKNRLCKPKPGCDAPEKYMITLDGVWPLADFVNI